MNAINFISDPSTIPARFTGKFRGQYYFKGRIWDGPSNAIGQGARKATFIRKPRAKCDLRGPNNSPSVDLEICAREGGLVLSSDGRVRVRTAEGGAA